VARLGSARNDADAALGLTVRAGIASDLSSDLSMDIAIARLAKIANRGGTPLPPRYWNHGVGKKFPPNLWV
jgi:hypothetical protein